MHRSTFSRRTARPGAAAGLLLFVASAQARPQAPAQPPPEAQPAPPARPSLAQPQGQLPELVVQMNRRPASLREALELAARQGPDVAAARAQAALTAAGVEKAWNAWKPDLSASGQFVHTNAPAALDFGQFARALTSFTNLAFTGAAPPAPVTITGANSTYGTLQLSQPLFTPQGLFLVAPANRAREAAGYTADEAREQVLLGVVRAYMGTQGLYGLLAAARDAEKVALRREEDARSRIAAGTAVEVDLLRAQNDTATARVNLANIQGQMQALLPLLEALTSAPIAPDPAGRTDPDLGAPADPASEPWEHAYALQAAVQQASAAAGAVRYDQFQWLPSVQGIARGNYTSNAGFTGKNTSYDLIIAASIPLYDRGQRYSALHEDEARLAAAQANLASTRAKARSTWLGARANLAAAQAVLAQSEAQVQFARRAQEQIDASARAGVATSLDLSDADNRAFQAASAVAQARAALEVRKAEVAAAEGRLFSTLRR